MDAPWPGPGWPLAWPWLALGLALGWPLAGPWPGPGWPLAWPWLALGRAFGWPGSDRFRFKPVPVQTGSSSDRFRFRLVRFKRFRFDSQPSWRVGWRNLRKPRL